MTALPAPVAGLIPALNPAEQLPELVRELLAGGLSWVIVVDDGSSPACAPVFKELRAIPGVQVLAHATNLGKGAALKTGLSLIYRELPEAVGVVTADADGQHAGDDILRVARALAEDPGGLVLGAREFDGTTPWRSRVGNVLTRRLVQLLVGRRLRDTQTGLRGIPRALIPPLLEIPSTGYEFELDMLIATKHRGVAIREVPIRTIYRDGNRGSHFNPLRDSLRIYFVLLRFTLVALLTAAIDNAVFFGAYLATSSVGLSQAAGRLVAMCFNFAAAKDAVFLAKETRRGALVRYVLLVAANGLISYALLGWIRSASGVPVLGAKIAAEALLFLGNFALQRDFVFTERRRPRTARATDWTAYYDHVAPTARLTRRYTARVLHGVLRRCSAGGIRSIVEIGGANSCFVDGILARWPGVAYRVIDTNEHGLELLRRRFPTGGTVAAEWGNVLSLERPPQGADVVYSVGLIEHFGPADTERAIRGHFGIAKEGGLVILSFPTPTWLYIAARSVCEAFGVWKFPDERPLEPREVLRTVEQHGAVLFRKTLWPLVFTQHLIAARVERCGALPAGPAAVPRAEAVR